MNALAATCITGVKSWRILHHMHDRIPDGAILTQYVREQMEQYLRAKATSWERVVLRGHI